MTIRRILGVLIVLGITSSTFAQQLWDDNISAAAEQYVQVKKASLPSNYRLTALNIGAMDRLRSIAPLETPAAPTIKGVPGFAIPLPDGSTLQATLAESPILSPDLAAALPGVKTYRLNEAGTNRFIGRITYTEQGITGLIFTDQGAVYLRPLGKDAPGMHMTYFIKDVKVAAPIICGIKEQLGGMQPLSPMTGDCQLRTFRLAVAATGEYTNWAGSQANALSYMTTTVNDVTAIYEREATIRFTLVTNNSVIYTDPMTDPYTTSASPTSTTLDENQSELNTNVGSSNYDLGIVFNSGWNGGLAQLSVVCNFNKGRAAAGLDFGDGPNPTPGPQGPIFDQTVAHEIAHQFSATHTFASTNGGCSGNTTAASAWEPGGGSTIMAYAGVCTGNFYQFYSDLYFHAGNLAQIASYVTGGSASCAVVTSSGNNAPTVSVASPSYTIPISTPFTLNATGSDADGNTLYYTFEEMDAGTSSSPPSATATSGPNFRSYPPGTTASRTFPRLQDIVAGVSPTYEVLPSVARTMNFRVTVRDMASGVGCTGEANVAVTTDGSTGPFIVTSQNSATTWTANGSNTAAVTWNVANTNNAPVNCATVDIRLSIDGGLTFPFTLASNTANDGSENVLIPNLPTAMARVMVQAHDNIFFNVNTTNFTITSSCSANGGTNSPGTSVSAPAGDPSLDLSLTTYYGSPVTIAGTIVSGDPNGNLAVNFVTQGSCGSAANQYKYHTYSFTPTVSGNYTFTKSASTDLWLIFNLYQGASAFVPLSPCSNFLASSATFDGSSTVYAYGTFTVALTAGSSYTLSIGTYDAGNPATPATYAIDVTAPSGGQLLDIAAAPGAGFNYTFVVVDNATGNIVAIDPLADLSNSGSFPGGTSYTVYGLSYSNTISSGTLNGYIGGPFTTLQNDALYNPSTFCSNVSRNQVQVMVLAATPVGFLGLSAVREGDVVKLHWKTASEQNNAYFEVQRSADGVSFTDILGNVTGAGNSNTVREYDYTDASPLPGLAYYRIRQVDLDGRYSYSNIATVRNAGNGGANLRLYPNPARSSINVEYQSQRSGKMDLELFDGKGAMIKRIAVQIQTGRNLIPVDLKGLSPGVYLVKLVGEGNTSIRRFVKD